MEVKLMEMLSAGGDLATMALFLVMWKFDRRILSIEIALKHLPRRKQDNENDI